MRATSEPSLRPRGCWDRYLVGCIVCCNRVTQLNCIITLILLYHYAHFTKFHSAALCWVRLGLNVTFNLLMDGFFYGFNLLCLLIHNMAVRVTQSTVGCQDHQVQTKRVLHFAVGRSTSRHKVRPLAVGERYKELSSIRSADKHAYFPSSTCALLHWHLSPLI